MLEGAQAGFIGAGIGMATAGILEAGKKVIAGMKATIEIVREFVKRPIEVIQAVLADIMYGPLDEITILGADNDGETPKYREIKVRAYRFTKLTGNSYTISSTEIHVSQDTIDYLRELTSASESNPAYDDLRDKYFEPIPSTGRGNVIEMHIAHEIGHTCQAAKLGPFYLPLVAPVTIFKSNPYLNGFERDASRRGLYGGIAK